MNRARDIGGPASWPPADMATNVAGRPPDARAPAPEIPSDRLLQGRSEVFIRHGDDTYRLRQTSKGKLILTK